MICLVNKGEEAGVIADGTAQDLVCAREFKELRKDTCMLTSAIEYLWKHQLPSDERMQYLFHQAEVVENVVHLMPRGQDLIVDALGNIQGNQSLTDDRVRRRMPMCK